MKGIYKNSCFFFILFAKHCCSGGVCCGGERVDLKFHQVKQMISSSNTTKC